CCDLCLICAEITFRQVSGSPSLSLSLSLPFPFLSLPLSFPSLFHFSLAFTCLRHTSPGRNYTISQIRPCCTALLPPPLRVPPPLSLPLSLSVSLPLSLPLS